MIAVRGTLTALDVLHDVTLWLVPAVLQRPGLGVEGTGVELSVEQIGGVPAEVGQNPH